MSRWGRAWALAAALAFGAAAGEPDELEIYYRALAAQEAARAVLAALPPLRFEEEEPVAGPWPWPWVPVPEPFTAPEEEEVAGPWPWPPLKQEGQVNGIANAITEPAPPPPPPPPRRKAIRPPPGSSPECARAVMFWAVDDADAAHLARFFVACQRRPAGGATARPGSPSPGR